MTKILGIGMSRCSDVHHFAAPCICANRIEPLSFRRVSEAREEESAGRRHGSWGWVVPGRRKSRFLRAEKRPFGMTRILGIGMSCCSDVRHFAAPCICANRIEPLSFRRGSEAREEESAGRRHGSWGCSGRRRSRFLRAEKRPFGMTRILGIGMSRCSDVHHFAATRLMSLRCRCRAFPKWELGLEKSPNLLAFAGEAVAL